LRAKNPLGHSLKLHWGSGWQYDLQTPSRVYSQTAWQLWRCVVILTVGHIPAVRFTNAAVPAFANLVVPLNNP
jgi:hypothetical protein